jgi:hypothetical protein
MSEYEQRVQEIKDSIENAAPCTLAEYEQFAEDVGQQIEELMDEQREKFDNLPEGFQQGPNGQRLEERADALDTWQSSLPEASWEDMQETIEADPTRTVAAAFEENFKSKLEEILNNAPEE